MGVSPVIRRRDGNLTRMVLELSPNFGDGLKDQAAAWA